MHFVLARLYTNEYTPVLKFIQEYAIRPISESTVIKFIGISWNGIHLCVVMYVDDLLI